MIDRTQNKFVKGIVVIIQKKQNNEMQILFVGSDYENKFYRI